jgi:hypothetical protein
MPTISLYDNNIKKEKEKEKEKEKKSFAFCFIYYILFKGYKL